MFWVVVCALVMLDVVCWGCVGRWRLGVVCGCRVVFVFGACGSVRSWLIGPRCVCACVGVVGVGCGLVWVWQSAACLVFARFGAAVVLLRVV